MTRLTGLVLSLLLQSLPAAHAVPAGRQVAATATPSEPESKRALITLGAPQGFGVASSGSGTGMAPLFGFTVSGRHLAATEATAGPWEIGLDLRYLSQVNGVVLAAVYVGYDLTSSGALSVGLLGGQAIQLSRPASLGFEVGARMAYTFPLGGGFSVAPMLQFAGALFRTPLWIGSASLELSYAIFAPDWPPAPRD